MRKIQYFFFSCLILGLQISLLGQSSSKNLPTLHNTVLDALKLDGVRVDAQAKSQGLSGAQIDLEIHREAATSLIGTTFSILIYFQDPKGFPINSSLPNNTYADERGHLFIEKKFRISKYQNMFGSDNTFYSRIHDEDTGEIVDLKTPDGNFPLKLFLPYYTVDIESGLDTIEAHFYVKEKRFNFKDTSRVSGYQYFDGIRKHHFYTNKPPSTEIKIGIKELEAQPNNREGSNWDYDLKDEGADKPDLYWKVLLRTEYKSDLIFQSSVAENTFFNRWHHEFTPSFNLCDSDPILIEIYDKDIFNREEFVGSWKGSFSEFQRYSQNGKEIQFGQVKRMLVQQPVVELQIQLGTVQLYKEEAWDLSSLFFDIEAPDLYLKLLTRTGKILYKSTVQNNSSTGNWSDAIATYKPEGSDTLYLKIYDGDFIQDDLIGTIEIPVGKILEIEKGAMTFVSNKELGEIQIKRLK